MKNEPLGLRISRRREELGLTQDRLAEMSGVSQNSISQIESGARPDPAMTSVQRLARALDMSLDDLLKGTLPDDLELCPNDEPMTLDQG